MSARPSILALAAAALLASTALVRANEPSYGPNTYDRTLEALIAHARSEGLARLSLETGVQPTFIAARGLYARAGFVECGPFGDYRPDPNSVFLTIDLVQAD